MHIVKKLVDYNYNVIGATVVLDNVEKYTKLYNQRNKRALEEYNINVKENKYVKIKDTIDTIISDVN